VSLDYLAAEQQTYAGSSGFSGEKGDKQVGGGSQAGAFVVDNNLHALSVTMACDPYMSLRVTFEGCVSGVSNNVYQELLELIRVSTDDHVWVISDVNRQPLLETRDAADHFPK
jgi:hypothetical protein